MNEEIWKDVVIHKGNVLYDYTNYYMVSNKGNIKRLETTVPVGIKHVSYGVRKEHLMKQTLSKKGYLYVKLSKNGVAKYFQVHRIVAEVFIENPDNKPQVNHLDENPLNNNVDNLSWSTISENINYGTRSKRAGEKLSVPIDQLDLNGNIIRHWSSMHNAHRIGGFNYVCICRCCKGTQATHKGYMWRYTDKTLPN